MTMPGTTVATSARQPATNLIRVIALRSSPAKMSDAIVPSLLLRSARSSNELIETLLGNRARRGTRKTGEPPEKLPRLFTCRFLPDSIVVAVVVLAETGPARIVIEYLTVVLNQVDGSGWSEDVRVERDRAKLRGRGATKVVDRALDIRAALLPSTDAREKFSRSEDGIELRSGRRVSAANAGPMAARRVGCNGRNIRLKGHAFVVPQMAVLVSEERAGELDGVGPEIFVRLPILSAARP